MQSCTPWRTGRIKILVSCDPLKFIAQSGWIQDRVLLWSAEGLLYCVKELLAVRPSFIPPSKSMMAGHKAPGNQNVLVIPVFQIPKCFSFSLSNRPPVSLQANKQMVVSGPALPVEKEPRHSFRKGGSGVVGKSCQLRCFCHIFITMCCISFSIGIT